MPDKAVKNRNGKVNELNQSRRTGLSDNSDHMHTEPKSGQAQGQTFVMRIKPEYGDWLKNLPITAVLPRKCH